MSAETTAFLNALKNLNVKTGKIIRYSQVAEQLNYQPHKTLKGKETKTLLKVGSQKYKEAVRDEVMRRSNALTAQRAEEEKQANIKPAFLEKKLITSLSQKFYAKYLVRYEGNKTLRDLYNAIAQQVKNTKNTNFVSIAYRDANKNIIYWRSIMVNYLRNYEDFKNEFEAINNANTEGYGSDAIDTNTYKPDYNMFQLVTLSIAQKGKSDIILFKSAMIESKEGLCAELSFNKCGYSAKQFGKKPSELRNLETFIDIIRVNKLPISIVTNAFYIRKTADEIITAERETSIMIKDKKRVRKYIVANLTNDDIIPEYIYSCINDEVTKPEHILVYDEVNQHIDYIGPNLELCDGVQLSLCNKIIKNEKVIFTPKTFNANMTRFLPKVPYEYLFFDYETVIDFNSSNCMQPYSLSVLRLSSEHLEMLDESDQKGQMDTVNKIRSTYCKTFLGYDCGQQFIEWFKTISNNIMFIFVGFNNTNFDNFLLLEDFLKYNTLNQEKEIQIDNIFYNGSQLLNFKIDARHNFFDIKKHLVGSLASNCASFKINCCAKKSFDHAKAQELHDEGMLIDFINNNEELREYNEFDVLATAVLFKRYKNALSNIPATAKYSDKIHDIKTIGSMIYKVFEDNKNNLRFNLPKLTYQQYTDLQRSKIAGRVEMFNGIQKVEERLVSTDVCSLYPFVMSVLDVYYPCGNKTVEVDEYKGDDVIGFYYCDIDQSNLKLLDLPNIYAKKSETENDWAYSGIIENYLISNVMIGLLRKYGCNVNIKNGFVFPERKKSCEMFGFLLDMMQAKNEQDGLKGQLGYNPALRETLKLLMNSLSGKVIEGLHTEKTVDVDNVADYLKIKEKAKSINFINNIGGKLFLTYEVDEETICAQQQRPIYLGVLIYDYAKRYMYENSYSKIGLSKLLYTDTDASKFRYSDFINWKKWVDESNVIVPHWPEVELKDPRYATHKIYEHGSKVFGSYEDELEEYTGDSYVFYCLQKKSWLYSWTNGDKTKCKYRFKGLNGNAQLLSLNEPFIGKHKGAYFIKPETEYEVYKYYENNKHNNIESNNELQFFEQVYSTGEAYVLNTSFRKIVKNSARNVTIEDGEKYNSQLNKIQVNYSMKRIQI